MTPTSMIEVQSIWVYLEIKFKSRSMSDPTISDIDLKNKVLGSELPLNITNKNPEKLTVMAHGRP